jgi:phage tail-like protein
MATIRDDPYTGFAFLVSLGGDSSGPAAGFARVSGLDREVELLTYRAGNDRSRTPRLVPGLAVNPTVTFERGIIGSLDLQEWVSAVTATGGAAARDLVVDLLDDDLASPVYRWLVRGALPTALLGPTLDANHGAIAVETLVVRASSIRAE